MSRTITIPEDERTNERILAVMNSLKFGCMECGKKFPNGKAAERAMNNNGCPKCGGFDIDSI